MIANPKANKMNTKSILLLASIIVLFYSCNGQSVDDKVEKKTTKGGKALNAVMLLPSWNQQPRERILKWLEEVTTEGSPNFIPVKDRITTFDNDGTTWAEQPMYFQLIFALDRIKELAADHPEWKNQEPYKSVIHNNLEKVMAQGMEGLMHIIAASHSGMTQKEFKAEVQQWVKTAKHPKTGKRFDQMVYQPMLELITALQKYQFKTYIFSAGGVDFMRAIVPEIYNIPEEQIIGSTIKTKYQYNDGHPKVERLPQIDFINDNEGKPVNIQKIIGKKPVLAAGNSDGDLQMLQWTASNTYKNLPIYIHHTDSEREWAYDRGSKIGGLDKGLDQAQKDGWLIVDMKNDWTKIFIDETKNNKY